MADPVSAAASIIAVIQISARVLSTCYEYISAVKDAPRDINWVINEVGSLKQILEDLRMIEEEDKNTANPKFSTLFRTLNAPNGPLYTCRYALERVEKNLGTPDKPRRSGMLIWPLKEKGVQKIMEVIQKQKLNLILAIKTNDIKAKLRIEHSLEENGDMICEIKDALRENSSTTIRIQETVQDTNQDREREKILRWLRPSDSSTNHNAAWKKHEPHTGTWLLQSAEFLSWKTEKKQLLWLHGILGAGKTVLSSTIVEHIKGSQESGPQCYYAYFYFDFRESKKQTTVGLLCSMLAQLSYQDINIFYKIKQIYNDNSQGGAEPSERSLISVLLLILEKSVRTYLIVDALDESSERDGVLEAISKLHEKTSNVNILVTSRREHDIELVLKDLATSQVCIQTVRFDADIKLYVQGQLLTDRRLRRFPQAAKQEIEQTLVAKAEGMFRWAVCQLQDLRSCVNIAALRRKLATLPGTLYETYDRILFNIPQDCREMARSAFQWLAFSRRPMTLGEVAEAIIVNRHQQSFDTENRLFDVHNLLDICSSLVSLGGQLCSDETFDVDGKHFMNYSDRKECFNLESQLGQKEAIDDRKEIRFAHYSVKEYIVSDTIKEGPARAFAVVDASAQEYMAEVCIKYLLRFNRDDHFYKGIIVDFPLLSYAAHNWHKHYMEAAANISSTIFDLTMSLFDTSAGSQFVNWMSVFFFYASTLPTSEDLTPLYIASHLGLFEVVTQLVNDGGDVNEPPKHSYALAAAVTEGHENIVRVLLEKGAGIYFQLGSAYHEVLVLAAREGRETIVRLLIDNGADVNVRSTDIYKNALTAAIASKNTGIVRILLDHGADVNIKGGYWGSPLIRSVSGTPVTLSASDDGVENHETVATMLLDYGADINLCHKERGTALTQAARWSSFAMTKFLLERGADVNIVGGKYHNAITAAMCGGNEAVSQLLIGYGADASSVDSDIVEDFRKNNGPIYQEMLELRSGNRVSWPAIQL